MCISEDAVAVLAPPGLGSDKVPTVRLTPNSGIDNFDWLKLSQDRGVPYEMVRHMSHRRGSTVAVTGANRTSLVHAPLVELLSLHSFLPTLASACEYAVKHMLVAIPHSERFTSTLSVRGCRFQTQCQLASPGNFVSGRLVMLMSVGATSERLRENVLAV
jgi:hypothetical protein